MKVKINYQPRTYLLTEDNYFKCAHEGLEIDPPCCSGFSNGLIDCACLGQYSVYCFDCKGEDLDDWEVDQLIQEAING